MLTAARTPREVRPLRRRALWLTAALCYLALAAALTAPLAWRLDRVQGAPIARADAWQKVYFFWHTRQAFEGRTNPLFARQLYAPHGASLALEPVLLPLATASLPAQYLAGPLVAYNLAALATLTLNGLAACWLALRLTHHRGAALLAGALWLASPIALSTIWHGQLEKAAWFLAPPLLLVLLALSRRRLGSRRLALLALAGALLLLTTALLGLYVFLYTCIFCALWTLALALDRRGARWRLLLRAALIPLLAAAPFWLIFGRATLATVDAARDDPTWLAISRTQGADLLDLLLPFAAQPGRVGLWQYERWPHTGSWQSAAGWTMLALAGGGLALARRRAGWLLGLGAAMLLLGLGASLRVAGSDTGLPLPYRLIEALPGVSVSRYPQLALLYTHLMLALAAGYGLARLARRLPPRRQPLLLGLVALALLAEYGWWRVDEQPVQVSPVYDQLAALPAAGSLLPLPYDLDTADALVAQMHHGRPIWGGYLARIPPYHEVEHVAILRQLWRNRREPADVVPYTADDHRTVLRFYGVDTVAVDRARLDDRGYRTFRAVWELIADDPPLLADDTAEIYAVPAPEQARPQVLLRLGWWEPEEGRRWMSEAATLRLLNPADGPARVRLRLGIAESLVDRLGVTWRGAALPDLRVVSGATPQTVELELELPPGEHELRLTAATQPRPVAGVTRAVSLQVARVELIR